MKKVIIVTLVVIIIVLLATGLIVVKNLAEPAGDAIVNDDIKVREILNKEYPAYIINGVSLLYTDITSTVKSADRFNKATKAACTISDDKEERHIDLGKNFWFGWWSIENDIPNSGPNVPDNEYYVEVKQFTKREAVYKTQYGRVYEYNPSIDSWDMTDLGYSTLKIYSNYNQVEEKEALKIIEESKANNKGNDFASNIGGVLNNKQKYKNLITGETDTAYQLKTPENLLRTYAYESDIKATFNTIMEDGTFVAKVANKSPNVALIGSVNLILNDSITLTLDERQFIIQPNSEVYVTYKGSDVTISKDADMKFKVNMLRKESFEDEFGYNLFMSHLVTNKLNIKNNKMDDKYIVEITNNTEFCLNTIDVQYMYLKDNNVVKMGYSASNAHLLPDDLYWFSFAFPTEKVEPYNNLEFDDFKCCIMNCEAESVINKEKIDYKDVVKVVKYNYLGDGVILLKLNNGSNDTTFQISAIDMTLYDKDKLVDAISFGKMDLTVEANDTNYVVLQDERLERDKGKYNIIKFDIFPVESHLKVYKDVLNKEISIETEQAENEIKMTVENKSKLEISKYYINCIFFNNNEPVAVVYSYDPLTKIKPGEKIEATLPYPVNGSGDSVAFDKYEIHPAFIGGLDVNIYEGSV